MMPKTKPVTYCEPRVVAEWIGLVELTLLGTEPIPLAASTVERLKLHGELVELTPGEVGAILRLTRFAVVKLTQPVRIYKNRKKGVEGQSVPRRVVLGHRQADEKLLISGADLAAWISLTHLPPVPTAGTAPPVTHFQISTAQQRAHDDRQCQRDLDELWRRHRVGRPPKGEELEPAVVKRPKK